MITNIWLKSQPNKKISFPDCWPQMNYNGVIQGIFIKDNEGTIEGSYSVEIIARVEFRP